MELSGTTISYLGKGVVYVIKRLLREPIELLTQAAFKKAYRISSLHKSHREYQQLWKRQLDEYVYFDINWSKLFLGKEQATCTLWVKAKPGKQYSKMTFCITASLDNLKYQSVVTIFNLNDIPCVAAISSIPLRTIERKDGQLYEPYHSVMIELIEAFDAENDPIRLCNKVVEHLHPFDNLEVALGLRKGDVYRWGKWWNLDFLEREKNELFVQFRGMSFHAQFYQRRFAYFWHGLAWLGKKPWFLNLLFWTKNIFTARQLENVLVEYLNDRKVRESEKTAK